MLKVKRLLMLTIEQNAVHFCFLHNELHSDRFHNARNKQCTEINNFQLKINFQFQPKQFWRVKNTDQNSDV